MKKIATLTTFLAVLACAPAATAQTIPAHPDKLAFKPFSYVPPSAASHRQTLKSGPAVYIAEDRELPLVSISILLRGGTYLDTAGKEGLADLTGYLITKGGTKKRTAEELDERLAFLAARLESAVSDDRMTVSLNLLSKDVDEGLAILREVLTEPRFQDNKIALRKDQVLNEMKTRNDDSAAIEARELRFIQNGEGFYTAKYATKASIEAITKDDLAAFHQKWFDPKGMIVAVAGDFSRADMLKKLEKLFDKWPLKAQTAPSVPKPAHKMQPGLYIVDKDVNQGRVSVLLPGITRDDPDFFGVQVMNDILGGGGFTSRITNRVRSDEGLAYSAGSSFTGGIWYPGFMRAGFQSKSRTCAYATKIVLEELDKMKSAEVSDEEIETAKRSFIDTLPRRFATKAATMGVLADEEFTGRYKTNPAYYQNYRVNIEKVTKADIKRVASRLLDTKSVTVLAVGKKADLLDPDPKYPIKFPELTGGKLTDVPLRDPFTMKPVTQASK